LCYSDGYFSAGLDGGDEMTGWIVNTSPRFKACIAGGFYLLAVLTAVFGETLGQGGLAIAAGLVAVSCFVVVTLLLYEVFRPVSQRVALLAAFFNLVAMFLEALRYNPRGVDVAMAFHGVYCLLIGYLVFKSAVLPRTLGILMALSGMAWATFLTPSLANVLSPYNVACGFVGEGSLMLWLLVTGVNHRSWKHAASPAGGWR
jgi:hypothetical protein